MNDKVILLVSVWLKKQDVDAFAAFEGKIAEIQARHGGRIERAIRVDSTDPAAPFEVHVVSFDSASGLAAYRADPAMQELASERERIIAKAVIIEGADVELY